MGGIHDFALFVASGLLLNFTPGPDTLYIVGRSATQGWRAGATAALGIGAGCCVHTVAAAIGVSAVLMASATAFTAIKLAGAAYLVYLGVQTLRHRRRVPKSATSLGSASAFRQGLLSNLGLLPQFVGPGRARQICSCSVCSSTRWALRGSSPMRCWPRGVARSSAGPRCDVASTA